MIYPLQTILKRRKILWRVTRNEMSSLYAGSLIGIGWIILAPLLFLALYCVVYLFVYRIRPATLEPILYVLYIFAGIIPFLSVSRSLALGTTSITANPAVIFNTVFPVELVPIKAVLMSQGEQLAGLGIILILTFFIKGFSWTVLLIPVVWAGQMMFMFGIVWVLALVNIAIRDTQYLINLVVIMLMIASPIAYTPDMMPEKMRLMIYLNPVAHYLMAYQRLIVLDYMPSGVEWLMLVGISLGSVFFGAWFFGRVKQLMIDYV